MVPATSDLELAWAISRHTFINRHGVSHCSPGIPLVIESAHTPVDGISYGNDGISLDVIRIDLVLTHDVHECRLGLIERSEILEKNMSR